MSDTETEKPAKKPGKRKKILLLAVLALIGGGGGVGAALYAGVFDLGGSSAQVDPDLPQLVLREGVDESFAAKYASALGDGSPDPSKFQATYYPVGESFTVNLRDGEGFVQIGLGVSTFYDERVLANVKQHEMAVRSAMLMTLSQQDMVTISTAQGKLALKRDLRKSVNDVLKARAGFGGIDDIYFTSFVVQ